MAIPKRISIKFYAGALPGFDITQAVPVFHRWVREHSIANELLIDVADYKHVVDGPGVLLVGHEADYGLALVDDRLELSYTRKRDVGDTLAGVFHTLFAQSLNAASLLESAPELAGLRVHTDKADIAILDRLHFANSDAGANAIGQVLKDVLAAVYSDGATLQRLANDPRQPLTVQVSAPGAGSSAALAARLAQAAVPA